MVQPLSKAEYAVMHNQPSTQNNGKSRPPEVEFNPAPLDRAAIGLSNRGKERESLARIEPQKRSPTPVKSENTRRSSNQSMLDRFVKEGDTKQKPVQEESNRSVLRGTYGILDSFKKEPEAEKPLTPPRVSRLKMPEKSPDTENEVPARQPTFKDMKPENGPMKDYIRNIADENDRLHSQNQRMMKAQLNRMSIDHALLGIEVTRLIAIIKEYESTVEKLKAETATLPYKEQKIKELENELKRALALSKGLEEENRRLIEEANKQQQMPMMKPANLTKLFDEIQNSFHNQQYNKGRYERDLNNISNLVESAKFAKNPSEESKRIEDLSREMQQLIRRLLSGPQELSDSAPSFFKPSQSDLTLNSPTKATYTQPMLLADSPTQQVTEEERIEMINGVPTKVRVIRRRSESPSPTRLVLPPTQSIDRNPLPQQPQTIIRYSQNSSPNNPPYSSSPQMAELSKSDIENLRIRNRDLESRVDKLSKEILERDKGRADIVKLNGVYEDNRKTIDSLKEQVQQLRLQITEMQNINDRVNNDNRRLLVELESLRKRELELKRTIEQMKAEASQVQLEKLQRELRQANADKEELKESLKLLQDEVVKWGKKYSDLNDEFVTSTRMADDKQRESQRRIDDLIRDSSQKEWKLKDSENKSREAERKLREEEEKSRASDRRILEMKSSLDDYEETVTRLEKRINELANRLQDSAVIENERDRLLRERNSLARDLQDAKNAIELKDSKITELETRLRDRNSKSAEDEIEKFGLAKKNRDLEVEVEALKKKISDLQTQVSQLSAKLRESEGNEDALLKRVKELQAESYNLIDASNKKDLEIQMLSQQLKGATALVSEKDQEIQRLSLMIKNKPTTTSKSTLIQEQKPLTSNKATATAAPEVVKLQAPPQLPQTSPELDKLKDERDRLEQTNADLLARIDLLERNETDLIEELVSAKAAAKSRESETTAKKLSTSPKPLSPQVLRELRYLLDDVRQIKAEKKEVQLDIADMNDALESDLVQIRKILNKMSHINEKSSDVEDRLLFEQKVNKR